MLKRPAATKAQVKLIKPIAGWSLYVADNTSSEYETFDADVDPSANPDRPIFNFSNFDEMVKPTSFKKFPRTSLDTNASQSLNSGIPGIFLPLAEHVVDDESKSPKIDKLILQTETLSGSSTPKELSPSILKKGMKSRFNR